VTDPTAYFRAVFDRAAAAFSAVDRDYLVTVVAAAELLLDAISRGRRVFVFGNGGSAADAQHIAAELVGRFSQERPALPAIALSTNTALVTAWSNDKGYEDAFARELSALAQAGDVAWAISTSGNSPNVLRAAEAARAKEVQVLAFSARDGGALKALADHNVIIPTTRTDRAQELHLCIEHVICDAVEKTL